MNPVLPSCVHGHTVDHDDTFDRATEVSACCGASVTIFTDDGEWYCKCCHGTVYPAT